MTGYDYGIKPRYAVIGPLNYSKILSENLIALGYQELDYFEILVNPAVLALIFSNEASAKECFEEFSRWQEGSSSTDGITISVILFNSNEFGLCIYPDSEKLLDRALPKEIVNEVDPLIISPGYMKLFPDQSQALRWFIEKTRNNPFVLIGGTEKYPIKETALRILRLNVIDEEALQENSLEYMLAKGLMVGERESPKYGNFEIKIEKIKTQRRRNFDRFFPVTQEYLRRNKQFMDSFDQLTRKGFKSWQIIQAACNIGLKNREPELFIDDQKASTNIIEYLVYNHETPNVVYVLDVCDFSIEKIEEQIHLDSIYLLRFYQEEISDSMLEIQSELDALNLL